MNEFFEKLVEEQDKKEEQERKEEEEPGVGEAPAKRNRGGASPSCWISAVSRAGRAAGPRERTERRRTQEVVGGGREAGNRGERQGGREG